jgi:hypothetical protein
VRARRLLPAALLALLSLAGLAAGAYAWLHAEPDAHAPAAAQPPAPGFPGGHPLSADAITEGRLAMARMPEEVGAALEQHSAEIVKNAQALESKQARVTGTCAPGSAIRVIAEDGTVSCQKLPRGVVSVAALAGVPRLSSTGTAQGSVPGGVGRYQVHGEEDFLVVPVELPDGAIVTGFSYVYYDADPRVDGAAYLFRSDDQPMAVLATSGADEQVRTVATSDIKLSKVDAARYAYFVYFQISAAAGPSLLPISASVSYKLP